jgi:CDP-paratose 2-epimerase
MTVARIDRRRGDRPVLITGGCGFLGSNLAAELAARGRSVVAADNFSRRGAHLNAEWLRQRFGNLVDIVAVDVRDRPAVDDLVADAAAVLHLAAQVAVTTSLQDPVEDFDINARGTLNVLEAVRSRNPRVPVIFASTNKVYGRLLGDGAVTRVDERYAPQDERLAAGIDEAAPLDFHSPYGCSKGAADQYVHDYGRVARLRTVVLRMSCIYGPRQFGTEDQGWIAHFLLQAMRRKPITIYGDGLQVRDALHVSDAVAAWLGALDRIDDVRGRVFNLGGGTANSISLLELLERIATLRGEEPEVLFDAGRPGDQPWYVTDVSAIAQALGWRARMPLDGGLRSLDAWLETRFGEMPARPHQDVRLPDEVGA